jgi:hypothetical protein
VFHENARDNRIVVNLAHGRDILSRRSAMIGYENAARIARQGRVDFTGAHSQLDAVFFGSWATAGMAITADLSVAQGEGLLGTGAVPKLLQTGPRKNTRFFFILTARL